jgi:hypothetical protein
MSQLKRLLEVDDATASKYSTLKDAVDRTVFGESAADA